MRLKPAQIVLISFLIAIVVGTILIKLPFSVAKGNSISLVDSFFTATSATCVTGLIVKDTGSFFSPFGKMVIFLLFQMGGLGIMTFSTLFAIALGKKLTISESVTIKRALNQQKIENPRHLIKYILFITLGFESIGAVFLFLRWSFTQNWTMQETLIRSVFHSVSAFCNAGFSLFSSSFTDFRLDPYINLTMMALIIFGGIGFIVILDLPKLTKFWRKLPKPSLHSKMAVIITICLIVIGASALFIFEGNNSMSDFSVKDRVFTSFFQSITARTAGFNTINVGNLLPHTLLALIFLMFIGASPGSTGGGIKTVTFGVIVATVVAMFRSKNRISLFKTTIPQTIVRKALAVFFFSICWIFFAALALLLVEYSRMGHITNFFNQILFEVTSAFGTVGLSTGITANLSNLGKVIITITMFVGRVGPLTAALAIAAYDEKIAFRYPEENLMVG